jgi:hypothetical protein
MAEMQCHLQRMTDTEAKPQPLVIPDPKPASKPLPKEIGGAPGPDPTRYGDWAHKGRVTDF